MSLAWPACILCPVDFSEPAATALQYAALLARCQPAVLTVVHAHFWEAPAYFTESHLEDLQRQFRHGLQDADRALEEYVARVCPRCDASRVVVDGAPVAGILETSGNGHSDLIVMGTHGRGGFNRLLLGSVTERVLRESTIPVLTVRARSGKEAPAIRNILCAVNDSPIARKSLELAAGLAGCLSAKLTVVRVAESNEAATAMPDICTILSDEERARCRVETVTRQGEAAAEILKLAGDLPADLIVVGAHHRPFRDVTVLGTTTVRVVRHSPVPVLTVV